MVYHYFRRAFTIAVAVWTVGCGDDGAETVGEYIVEEVDTVVSLESQRLAAPSDVAVDEDGTVYVLDSQLAGVLVVPGADADPVFHGGEGAGPGEFDGPLAIAVTRDTIRVVEAGNGRVQMLSTEGGYARSFPLAAGFLGGFSLSGDGHLAVPTQGFREEVLVLRYGPDGEPAGGVGEPVVPPHDMWDMRAISSSIESGQVPASLRNMSLPVVEDDGSLWLILQAEAIVRRYDPEGEPLWSTELRSPELAAIEESFFTRNRELEVAAFIPLRYASDAVAVNGRLFVLLNTPTEDPATVLVLGAEGEMVARIVLPSVRNADELAVDTERGKLYLTVPSDASLLAAALPELDG
ncbi:MAG: hypothetical protein GWN99_15310 [Gemmatimonadetes bacterium]|uniref:SMP-30/Gluconolactonase/LRE-like region domain-containing protein n=1 Tax=Candidatus Kutchimonas denitrificans TaxID=3056748 RepID=A0AAE5CAM4_9BACT|nr:hypothetical protein [Gemmatimonadota bacterium]NIR76666.1 hypothetical protein [Candidatus Kutchimonas denitrificans]NIS02415.1 hypothetical protein [Gemmatimonadota bacterium]NIT68319.1 hypothetical protein [Gemmatimonadota bacterium]NIU54786.1 hypothetical protein [Gemmatimonadota bacterium]